MLLEDVEAVAGGSALISKLIESTSRNAWTKAAGASGLLAPPTSNEDCYGTATQARCLSPLA